MVEICFQVHNLIQILVIMSRHALLQAGFFMPWSTVSLPNVYHRLSENPWAATVSSHFLGSSIYSVYQKSTTLIIFYYFRSIFIIYIKLYNKFKEARVVMLCDFGKKVRFLANI